MSFPGYQNAFGFPGIYFSDVTAKPLTDGEGSAFLVDQYRRLVVTVGPPSPPTPATSGYAWRYVSTALEHQGVAHVGASLLAQAMVSIDPSEATNVYFLQFFNSAVVPPDGTVPSLQYAFKHITGGDVTILNLVIDDSEAAGDKTFTLGVSWCISSTQFTKTAVASNKASLIAYGY